MIIFVVIITNRYKSEKNSIYLIFLNGVTGFDNSSVKLVENKKDLQGTQC